MAQRTACNGVKIEGAEVKPYKVTIDDQFEKCPIAFAAGIPLMVKRLFNERPYPQSNKYVIVRVMSVPEMGLAPMDWQYGGMGGPCPAVIAARTDGIDFQPDDFWALDDFEMQMLDDGPCKVTRQDFDSFAECYLSSWWLNRNTPHFKAVPTCMVLEALYPKGMELTIRNLKSRPELNGATCNSAGEYTSTRVGVTVGDASAPIALKPENLIRPAPHRDMFLG